jgi:hypothetical protein
MRIHRRELPQQTDSRFRTLAHPDDSTAADGNACRANALQSGQTLVVRPCRDDLAVELRRGVKVVVVRRQSSIRERVGLLLIEHPQRATRFHTEGADAAHHLEHTFELRSARHVSPRRAHAEPRRALSTGRARRTKRIVDAHQIRTRHTGLVVGRLRTVRAVLRTSPALDVEKDRTLDLVCGVVLAMDKLGLEDEVDEGRSINLFDFCESPVVTHEGAIIAAGQQTVQLACTFNDVLCSIEPRLFLTCFCCAVGPKAAAVNDSSPARHSHAHLVQLFDAPRSLADAVSHYLIEGRAEGQHLLVIGRASHWQLTRAYLERRGFLVDDSSERLTVIDARKIRGRIMRRGLLDPGRMEETLGGMLAELSAAPGGLRVYGEIVELFAEEGNFEQACALEDYWNHLQTKYGFTLLCGYSAAHFADPRNSHYLREVCGRHTAVKSQPSDSLGTWLTTR